jgi:hypothetical protein
MDIIDILGGLLRKKSGDGGPGGDILGDILRGGTRSGEQQQRRPAPPRGDSIPDINSKAKELEDLLNVAHGQNTQRTNSPPPSAPRRPQSPERPIDMPQNDYRPAPPANPRQPSPMQFPPAEVSKPDDRALVLVRAMILAAKCDGQISPEEQQRILDHVDGNDPETIQFLRCEFARPLDIREFALSVPIGMEQEVYSLSLMAIDLDTRREAGYLNDLAQLLRIPTEVRNQIHRQLGEPTVG